MAKYFYQYFQIFSIFIYNEGLLMKSDQFFKYTNALIRKEKKHSYSRKKKNWQKLDFVFNRLFYKALLIIIHFSYFASSFTVQFPLFDIRMMKKISKYVTGNGKELEMANYNIYFKNNLNCFLVINITQINFIYLPNVHIYNFSLKLITREVCRS